MTTLAPVPGRDPDDSLDDPPVVETVAAAEAASEAVEVIRRRPKPLSADSSAMAPWLFGLALSLLSEGTVERVAMAEVLAAAAGRSRPLEGAYGRGVALLSEYPGDPLVLRTVDLLAKALLRSRRPAREA